MNESQTPYLKIESVLREHTPQSLEMDTSQPITSETDTFTGSNIIPRQWSSLCEFDLESCFVSVYVPCHVMGKVGTYILSLIHI